MRTLIRLAVPGLVYAIVVMYQHYSQIMVCILIVKSFIKKKIIKIGISYIRFNLDLIKILNLYANTDGCVSFKSIIESLGDN